MGMNPLSSSDEAYRQAGVDLKSASAVVEIAKRAASVTRQPFLLGGIGGFSGGFEIPPGYRNPVLLCACDGVGTKLKIAFETGKHDTIGIDLVAMSVNDILVSGGRPLVFLDYLATGRIEPAQVDAILQGIAEGCRQSGCALAGGETAEMPGFYQESEYDLAGFCVGIVERDHAYPKTERLQAGDLLIGLASSGLHSNGYSLVRKLVLLPGSIVHPFDEPVLDILLTPTRIYVSAILGLLQAIPNAVKAMVHVTGGGFYDNIPRSLKPGLSARIDTKSWPVPPVFDWLQELGELDNETMWHTFNCGIGFVVVIDPAYKQEVLNYFENCTTEKAYVIGELMASPNESRVLMQ